MKTILSTSIILLSAICMNAQSISHDGFFQSVAEKNAEYMAEKYNIDIATANLQAAKVFNDPELSVDYGNNQDWMLLMGQSLEVGLSIAPDLAGVRRARVAVARTEKEIAEASTAAFFSALRYEAAEAWAEAWGLRELCSVMEAAVEDMKQIAISDSLRFSVGEIGQADALQSKLEARALAGEYTLLKAQYQNALMNLSRLQGGGYISDLSDGALPFRKVMCSEADVCDIAEANRADLKAAELSHTLSEKNLKLIQASRSFEMGLNLGYSYNTEVRNEIAPAPKFNGLSVGVTIPLKFSSMNRAEVKAAETQMLQSDLQYEAARQQVRMEASQAYNAYIAASSVLEQYDDDMLRDAGSIMEGRKAGYLKGESSLLELLEAQQTYRDVMQAYIEANCSRYLSMAGLEHAVGL